MYSTNNKGKSVVAKRTLKGKIYIYMLQYQKMCISIN